MSKLLIHEPPLQVLPSLAKLIGLAPAIVLQQLHYHSLKSRDDGWVQKSLPQWQEEDFTFMGLRSVVRAFETLRSKGVIETEVVPGDSGRETKVRVDHEALDRLLEGSRQNGATPSGQIGATHPANLARPSTKGEKERTTETPQPPGAKVIKFGRRQVPLDRLCCAIALLETFNEKAGTSYGPWKAGAVNERPTESLKRIIGAVMEHPEISVEIGERMITLAFAGDHYWAPSPAQPGNVFGPNVVEKHLQAALRRPQPQQSSSIVDRLDARRNAA